MVAAGVGGPITGKGADLLVIDDPVKDAKDAESETQRKAKKDWYQQVARTRLHPGGAIVLVMTRWHEADLAGWLQEEAKLGGEQWEQLTLPMVSDSQILWPERYSAEEVDNLRKAVGSRAWEALYQQRPSPQEGGIFKRHWWKRWDGAPIHFEEVVQSWDCAFKDLSDSDYVVGGVIGRRGANKYLLDVVRRRMSFTETCQAIKALSAKWPTAHAKYVEDKANGTAVIDALRDTVSGLIAVNPEGGKVARARAVEPDVEAGNWWLPQGASWADNFIEECAAFPNGAHDDQVDMLTQAGIRLRANSNNKGRLVIAKQRDAASEM